ncbi:hypothetical protein QJQ58_10735 [Paenibacillus dendritiformis]|uniref:hypothetical protein n=1 Tax=Paenibacillus dendritiformis TaxID=130049 RepID=UPI00248CF22B|nr:hypothetical protein [Paenibacillus dendritiformis]WGU96678.1 hypothetical protein QJQ58_10735 [Paenibacillus dendritiformis]
MASYQKMSAVLAVLCMLVMVSPAGQYADLVKPAAAEQRDRDVQIKLEQLDKEILRKVDSVYQELSGSPNTRMSWESVSEGPNGLYLLTDKEGNQAQVKRETGEVSMAVLYLKAEQVGEALRSAAAKAVKEIEPAWSGAFDQAQRTYHNDREVFTTLNGDSLSVTLDGGNVSGINFTCTYANMPQAVKEGAERLLQVLGNKSFSIQKAVMYSSQNKLEWRLEAKNNSNKKSILILLNAVTGEVDGYPQF